MLARSQPNGAAEVLAVERGAYNRYLVREDGTGVIVESRPRDWRWPLSDVLGWAALVLVSEFSNPTGFTVREVDESHDPPHVHLNHDSDWTRAINDQLPDQYYLDGGRDSDNGRWHFQAVTPEHGRPVGDGYSESMDEAMQQAIGHATEHHRQSQN